MRDISQESTREVIPDSLYWLIRLIISPDDKKFSDRSSMCTNMIDERQVLSIAQDIVHFHLHPQFIYESFHILYNIVHCCTNGREELPKHTILAMCVYHLTSWRQEAGEMLYLRINDQPFQWRYRVHCKLCHRHRSTFRCCRRSCEYPTWREWRSCEYPTWYCSKNAKGNAKASRPGHLMWETLAKSQQERSYQTPCIG